MEIRPAIKIDNLSKKYFRGSLDEGSLRGITTNFWRNQNYKTLFKRKKKEAFWALHNINLEVKKGEILGIIGNNGAGKSTLLKVLAGITPPTEGVIEIFGRIAPMLEIGAGFHGDLNGRDNIFLNGAIMGMTHQEIENHFMEILEFSGLATFVETPIKYYSSGMRIRLAFAIAAFLQPEILLVDEVLAVGDVSFQKKCLAKMEERANQGISILFVSHDLEAVKRLCTRCIYLENGKIVNVGPSSAIIEQYLVKENIGSNSKTELLREVVKPIYFSKIALLKEQFEYFTHEAIPIYLCLKIKERLNVPVQIWMEISDISGRILIQSGFDISKDIKHSSNLVEIHLEVPSNTLLPGTYGLVFGVWNLNGWIELDKVEQKIEIKIVHNLIQQLDQQEDVPVIDCNWEICHSQT